MIGSVNLAIRGKRNSAVTGVTFGAGPGEIVAVFGPSGAGKSTLIQALAGRTSLDSGELNCRKANRGSIHLINESTLPARGSTVHQWLSKVAASTGVPLAHRVGRVMRAMEAMDLYPIRDLPAREISRGQMSAVQIGCALSGCAPILLIDAVLDSLPLPVRERAWANLRVRASSDSCAVVIATSDSDLAERADKVLILECGRQIVFESPSDLLLSAGGDTIVIEATDPALVQATLRGKFDVRVDETSIGASFTASDTIETVARLFRHPPMGARTVYVKKPDLWDVLKGLLELN